MIATRLTVNPQPISDRPFRGLGVQADAFLYDQTNREMGVTDEHLALYRDRLAALRPAIVRVFAPLDHFNPSFDARTYDWQAEPFQRMVSHLRDVQALGARVNVCMGPWTNAQMAEPGTEKAAVDLIERLRNHERLSCIAYLTLFNEPECLFAHQSENYPLVFGHKGEHTRSWDDYVQQHQSAHRLLQQRGLFPDVKLIVADTVYGHPIRRERIELTARDLPDEAMPVSYHHYSPEDPDLSGAPGFHYPGLAAEAAMFRQIVGPSRELVAWEFNNGGEGFGDHFMGTGRNGQDLVGSMDAGPMIARKVITTLTQSVDGMCLWCLCDMYYNCGLRGGPMRFGLWRYIWEGFRPRPYFYYYAALTHALRPGAPLHAVPTQFDTLQALAAHSDDGWACALLNSAPNVHQVQLNLGEAKSAKRLRVYPQKLPTHDQMPVDQWEPLPVENGAAAFELLPDELAIVRWD